MIVRRLTPADVDAYRALRLGGLRESSAAFGSTYEEEVDRPIEAVAERLAGAGGTAVYGAFDDDGTLLGMGGVHRETKLKSRHRAGIWGMYVAPEARGRGVGRALLQALVEHARTMEGVDRLDLSLEATNTAARELYRAFGFVTWGVQPDAYRAGGQSWDAEMMWMAIR
jgi:ribosomal protein S18 acetylase RimI-like enzyme